MSETIAFLFPGQGKIPNSLPTGSDRINPLVELTQQAGLELRAWMEAGDESRLRQTDAAQPALLLDSLSREEQLRTAGWTPAIVAGHSLGEYGALVSAQVLEPEDAVRAVIERGRLMNTVEGTMAAIVKLEIEAVEALCAEIGPEVVIANHNGPTQIVVSGTFDAVQALCESAVAAGARAFPLEVSGPFHSPGMRPAERTLAALLQDLEFSAPSIPVVSGVAGSLQSDASELKNLLCGQITARVRWVDVLEQLKQFGVTTAIEVGAGDVLTKLGKRSGQDLRFITFEEAIHEIA